MMKKTPTTTSYKGYNNRPHKIPDPKLLKIDELYSLSLNPGSNPVNYVPKNDTFQYNYRVYTNKIINIINKCKNCKITMYPELSSSGKYHYHGYITILNIAYFMLYDIHILKQYSCFEIDIINDSKIWSEYVFKGKHYMEIFCKDEKIPYKLITNMNTIGLKEEDKLFNASYDFEDFDDIDVDDLPKSKSYMVPDSSI